MKNTIFKTSIFSAILLIASGTALAQKTKTEDMNGMKDKPEMSEMMKNPNHRIMMAYRQNMNALAKTLEDLAATTANLDFELAEAMVADIRRSAKVMDMVHRNHMGKMDSEMKEKMAPMMEKIKAEEAKLAEHITALESALSGETMDLDAIRENAAAIVKMTSPKMMKGPFEENMKMKDEKPDM